MIQRSIVSQLLVISLLLQAAPAFAAGSAGRPSVLDSLQQTGPAQTAEYIFRNSPRDNLITVQLFGSVVRPGIYYVPEDTDLMRILTLAGGVVNTGELDEVIVRKTDGKAWAKVDDRYVEQTGPGTYSVNVDKLVRYTNKLAPLKLGHNDFVYIPLKEPFISNDASKIITLAGVVLTAVLTVVLIHHYNKD
jgi:competence protein ComEA